jgi:hypothetical protein
VIPVTIQYLNERMKFEVGFLERLARSSVPVTLVWGVSRHCLARSSRQLCLEHGAQATQCRRLLLALAVR